MMSMDIERNGMRNVDATLFKSAAAAASSALSSENSDEMRWQPGFFG
jgi:hypothetical protein